MNEMDKYGEKRIQVRCDYDINRIHIQGVGTPTVNREYGMAIELRAPPEITSWLREQEPDQKSPASGGMFYVKARVIHYTEHDTYQLHVFGDELNHKDGVRLDLAEDVPLVQTLLKFADNNLDSDILAAGIGTPYTTVVGDK